MYVDTVIIKMRGVTSDIKTFGGDNRTPKSVGYINDFLESINKKEMMYDYDTYGDDETKLSEFQDSLSELEMIGWEIGWYETELEYDNDIEECECL